MLSTTEPRQLHAQVAHLTQQMSEVRERMTRIEARSEIYTPFPHVHELYDRLTSRLSEVSDTIRLALSALQSEHDEDVGRLSEAVAIGQLKIQEIQADLESLIAQSHQKRAEEASALLADQKKLSAAMDELGKQVEQIQKREVGVWRHIKALWGRMDAGNKAYKALAGVVATAMTLFSFYVAYGAGIWDVLCRAAHDIYEVIRHTH